MTDLTSKLERRRAQTRARRPLSAAKLLRPLGGGKRLPLRSSGDIIALLEHVAACVFDDENVNALESARVLTYVSATAANILKQHHLEARLDEIELRVSGRGA